MNFAACGLAGVWLVDALVTFFGACVFALDHECQEFVRKLLVLTLPEGDHQVVDPSVVFL